MANLLFLLLFTTFAHSSIGRSNDFGNDLTDEVKRSIPLFFIEWPDSTRYFYRVTGFGISENHILLDLSRISSLYRPKEVSPNQSYYNCFRTSSWAKKIENRNLSVSNNKLSFIFARASHIPRPYPIPFPLPFITLKNDSNGRRYQMDRVHNDIYGRKMSREVTTIEFSNIRENISFMDLYNEGFTDFVPCSEL